MIIIRMFDLNSVYTNILMKYVRLVLREFLVDSEPNNIAQYIFLDILSQSHCGHILKTKQ